MKKRSCSKRKLATVMLGGGMLLGLDPCVPNDFFYNLAGQARDSLALNLADLVVNSITEQFLPPIEEPDEPDGGGESTP